MRKNCENFGNIIGGGSFVVTDNELNLNKVTGGSIIVSTKSISVDHLTGGAILISKQNISINKVDSAADFVSANGTVAIKDGNVQQISIQETIKTLQSDEYDYLLDENITDAISVLKS